MERSIIGEGTEIYGEVHNSVIGAGVTVKKGAVIRDSIIMKQTVIGENDVIDKAIIAENVTVGDNAVSYTHLFVNKACIENSKKCYTKI